MAKAPKTDEKPAKQINEDLNGEAEGAASGTMTVVALVAMKVGVDNGRKRFHPKFGIEIPSCDTEMVQPGSTVKLAVHDAEKLLEAGKAMTLKAYEEQQKAAVDAFITSGGAAAAAQQSAA